MYIANQEGIGHVILLKNGYASDYGFHACTLPLHTPVVIIWVVLNSVMYDILSLVSSPLLKLQMRTVHLF
jgi:hypothetical protein